MSHCTIWRCDRCHSETREQKDITEIEMRFHLDATDDGRKRVKTQHDLCPACQILLEQFLKGSREA